MVMRHAFWCPLKWEQVKQQRRRPGGGPRPKGGEEVSGLGVARIAGTVGARSFSLGAAEVRQYLQARSRAPAQTNAEVYCSLGFRVRICVSLLASVDVRLCNARIVADKPFLVNSSAGDRYDREKLARPSIVGRGCLSPPIRAAGLGSSASGG